MNRRSFIEKAVILGSAAFLPIPGFSKVRAPEYKMGLQLYTIHEEMTKDPIATLKAVKAMKILRRLGLIVKMELFTAENLRSSKKYWMICN